MATRPQTLTAFKAYDIRGRIPDELNPGLARDIARAFAAFLRPKRVAVGYDIRLSSPEFAEAVRQGLTEAGVDVVDIGMCGTEQVYFATFHLKLDGGVMITASHNPADYNGLKLVRDLAKPISADTGLKEIEQLVLGGNFPPAQRKGTVEKLDTLPDYIEHLLGYVDIAKLEPLKIVANPGNGGASIAMDKLVPRLPFQVTKIFYEPDGRFPNGIPNPLLPERRKATADALLAAKADVAIAWDGDFDRCFLFDETGAFIEGYYIVGLLASQMLKSNPGSKIVHDPRMTWNTLEIVREAGGTPVESKSGHAFMKEVMRREDAVYGGEMSAHHFFRQFSYCDSGMIPWLLVLQMMCETGKPLSVLVDERIQRFPASGEINRRVDDAPAVLRRVRGQFAPHAVRVEEIDGIGLEFPQWRFNLRASNTEPLIRLNVETRGDQALLSEKTDELLAAIGGTP